MMIEGIEPQPAKRGRGRPKKIDGVQPVKAPTPTPTPTEREKVPRTRYYPMAWPHVICPQCGAGDPLIFSSRMQGIVTVRYHRCGCGLSFRSDCVESIRR